MSFITNGGQKGMLILIISIFIFQKEKKITADKVIQIKH